MSKTNKSNSTSVSVDHRKYKNYSVVSRSNSFSSCSNDSVVYSDNGVQTRFGNAKRTLVNNSTVPRKRSRNSSGSSISSNMSCVSDKDLKSSKMISPTLNSFEMKNCVSNKTGVSRLKYSKINANSGELKEETIINKEVSCSGKSLVILPKQHNLRGKITKKGCACCPSTCTTVVLRRYKKYVKTSEETVISSTKVKTYVQKRSRANTEANERSYMSSPESKPRKRRSELEKLYASLHEIEWAKNFSPDNILSQINVRQAASHSAFGRSPNNTKNVSFKICNKKQKDISHFDCKVDSSHNNSPSSLKSNISIEECAGSSSEANMSKEVLSDCDTGEKTIDLQTAQIGTSDMYHCTQNYKSCNSQSSVNITTCSMSHIKEISINSMESVRHTESLISENGADYSDDAQLSYTSDESSSAVSTSIVNIQSKHLLDFDYKGKQNRDFSETDVSEYSTAPTFFDIAEEGIRTIDACFREVGAEVVVSTCYDEDSSLPLLTSIKENKVSGKALSNDDPPVLEPYIDVTFTNSLNCSEINKSEKAIENNKINQDKDCHTTKINDVCHSTEKLNSQSILMGSKTKDELHSPEKKNTLSQNINHLSVKFGKKIMKKYLKQSHSRSRLKSESSDKVSDFVNTNSDCSHQSVQKSPGIKSCIDVKKNINSPNHQQSILCTSYPKPVELFCKSPDKKTKVIFKTALKEQYSSNKTESTVVLQSAQSGSCFFQNGKILKYSNTSKKSSCIPECGASETKLPLISTSYVSTTIESESSSNKEQISRLPLTLRYSCHYKSIRVNRSYNYTNIILMVTRGKSMFLTLEVLSELKDAVNRTNNDSSCQVLIVNGVGDSFCLGLDLIPLVGPRKKIASTEMAVAIKELIEALSEFKKPLAAVVNGPALGLGMTLLNHADFTIASDKATFCMPYSYLGYMPEGGATLTLPQIVGSTVAMDLLLRGKTLTAREARNVGLISEVLEAKRLPHELVTRVRMLAENPLSALETTKALLKMQLHVNLRLVLENEVKLLPRMWLTRTCQDALRRALESGLLSD